jgi:hypothetical protein
MIVLTDHGFVSASENPATMKPVKKGTWSECMLVATF